MSFKCLKLPSLYLVNKSSLSGESQPAVSEVKTGTRPYRGELARISANSVTVSL